MTMNVLAIAASPRAEGNTDLLLREAIRGAQSAGAQVQMIALRDLTIAPCAECDACQESGSCRIQDDFQTVLSKMLEADRLILATPIFFMAVSAQAKILIDRCQSLWARKYVLKRPLFPDAKRDRRGLVIAVGGSGSTRMFDSVRLTMKYWFDALEVAHVANLFVNRADRRGAVLKRPEALEAARRLGRALAALDEPMPEKPITVELFAPR